MASELTSGVGVALHEATSPAPELMRDVETRIATQYEEADIQVIRQTVAKHATEPELKMFLSLCMHYRMDPFLGHMWCYKMLQPDDKPEDVPAVISVSFEGHLVHAARQPGYLGPPRFGIVRAHDHFAINWAEAKVEHLGKGTGQIVGAWAKLERGDCPQEGHGGRW